MACHRALEDPVARLFARDIHAAKGISCAGCHGGDATAEDPDVAMSHAAGFLGVPKGDSICYRVFVMSCQPSAHEGVCLDTSD